MGQSPIDVFEKAKMTDVSRDMGQHHDAWIMLLGTKMTIKCDVVSQRLNMHARTTCVGKQA